MEMFSPEFYNRQPRSRSVREKCVRYIRRFDQLRDAERSEDIASVIDLRRKMEELEFRISKYIPDDYVAPTSERMQKNPVDAAIFGATLVLEFAKHAGFVAESYKEIMTLYAEKDGSFSRDESDEDEDLDDEESDSYDQHNNSQDSFAEYFEENDDREFEEEEEDTVTREGDEDFSRSEVLEKVERMDVSLIYFWEICKHFGIDRNRLR